MSKNDIASKITFDSRIDIEIILSMITLTNWKYFDEQIEKSKSTYDEDHVKLISEMDAKISNYMRQEMECFFSYHDIGFGVLAFLFKQRYSGSFPEVLRKLEVEDESIMLSYIAESFLVSNLTDEKQGLEIYKNRSDINLFLNMVRNAEVNNKELKDKVIDLLTYPEETKSRFILIYKGFYEKIFKPIEESLSAKLIAVTNKYRKYLETQPEVFAENFLRIKLEGIIKDINIHVSYFLNTALLCLETGEWDKTFMIVGANVDKHFEYETKIRKDNVQKLFKLLSDKIRIDIIQVLNERPWYNQELAEKIGVSPSTVNHHIGLMVELDLICTERDDHRVYFILKRDRLRELMEQSTKIILGE